MSVLRLLLDVDRVLLGPAALRLVGVVAGCAVTGLWSKHWLAARLGRCPSCPAHPRQAARRHDTEEA